MKIFRNFNNINKLKINKKKKENYYEKIIKLYFDRTFGQYITT